MGGASLLPLYHLYNMAVCQASSLERVICGHHVESFCGCFGTSSGTDGPSLVKLLVEESTRGTLCLLFCGNKQRMKTLTSSDVSISPDSCPD